MYHLSQAWISRFFLQWLKNFSFTVHAFVMHNKRLNLNWCFAHFGEWIRVQTFFLAKIRNNEIVDCFSR